jgi:outer membrane protein OmpA-like peptidoglycan-associated protein
MKYALCIALIVIIPGYAEFNRTSGLIDIPTARILPHLGYRFGADITIKLGTGTYDQVFEENLHASLGLGNFIELYADAYTFGWHFTAAAGFCHNFYNGRKLGLAWGVHTISYDAHVSEINHGDSTGWHDDLLYDTGNYQKPFEVGSGFLVATYALTDDINATLGLGRGRYVGYGRVSKYFNTNFYHDTGGNWGFGLFGGLEFKPNEDLSLIIEGDGRDINVGCVYQREHWEFGLAFVKCEYFADWDEYRPRGALSLSYVQAKKPPGPGILAGTVVDTHDDPLLAEVYIADPQIPRVMTEPDQGSYEFIKMTPGLYEVYAWADGYKQGKKKIEVIPDETVFCDFVLEKATGNIIGAVVDMLTDKPLIADLAIDEIETSTASDENGDFAFTELQPAVYEITAQASGYVPATKTASVFANETTEVLIKLMKQVITLEGVYFDFDKATLRSESYPVLDRAAEILKTFPDIVVEIQGHTCSLGSDEYNLKLSNDRANAVVDYLITHHMIESSRLIPRGYGEMNPIATNDTPEGRAQNRRIDFVIVIE